MISSCKRFFTCLNWPPNDLIIIPFPPFCQSITTLCIIDYSTTIALDHHCYHHHHPTNHKHHHHDTQQDHHDAYHDCSNHHHLDVISCQLFLKNVKVCISWKLLNHTTKLPFDNCLISGLVWWRSANFQASVSWRLQTS